MFHTHNYLYRLKSNNFDILNKVRVDSLDYADQRYGVLYISIFYSTSKKAHSFVNGKCKCTIHLLSAP